MSAIPRVSPAGACETTRTARSPRGRGAATLPSRRVVRCTAAPLLWLVVSVAASAVAHAAEPAVPWASWRGDSRNTGVAQGPLPSKLAKRWVYATGGPVKSSAVLGHGRTYIGSDDGALHAIDLVTGKRAWAFQADGGIEAPPLIHGETIFVGSTGGTFYALGLDGKQRWKADAEGKVTGSAVAVVEAKSGRTLVLVGSHAGTLQAFDAASPKGKPVWKYSISDPINGGIGISAGRAIFGGCDGQLHVVSVADGKSLTSIDGGGIIASSVALDGNDAYFGTFHNEFLRVGIASGEVAWRFHDQEFQYYSSPALTDSAVVFGGQDQRLHALDRRSGKPLWELKAKGRVDSSPVVSGDRVVVGSHDGRLYLVELATGKLVDSFEVGGRISGTPAVGPKLVVVGTESNEVYAFGDAP